MDQMTYKHGYGAGVVLFVVVVIIIIFIVWAVTRNNDDDKKHHHRSYTRSDDCTESSRYTDSRDSRDTESRVYTESH